MFLILLPGSLLSDTNYWSGSSVLLQAREWRENDPTTVPTRSEGAHKFLRGKGYTLFSTGRLAINAVYPEFPVDADLGLSTLPLPLSSSPLSNPSDISNLLVLKSKPPAS